MPYALRTDLWNDLVKLAANGRVKLPGALLA